MMHEKILASHALAENSCLKTLESRKFTRAILKTVTFLSPLHISPIRRWACEARSTSACWHLDSTHKLIKYETALIGITD